MNTSQLVKDVKSSTSSTEDHKTTKVSVRPQGKTGISKQKNININKDHQHQKHTNHYKQQIKYRKYYQQK